jgi:isopropylmalate/homocitrate/citramalate synthase
MNNATTAWLYGCCGANGTLLGLGERTGNTPLDGLIIEYIELRGETNGIDTTVITDIAEYYEKEIGYHIPANQPFTGRDFNVTRAGIHADGLTKDEEIYNIFDTVKLLKRQPGVSITDKSGAAGIAHWLNTHLKLEDSKRVDKTLPSMDRKVYPLDKSHPAVIKIKDWIDAEYASERTTAISDEEMLAQAKIHLPEHFK